MMLLGIDTCGASGTVALARWEHGAISLVAQKEIAGKTYSVQLVPTIQQLLEEQKTRLEDLEAVVVVHGPGSFTGVRIGVSTAKALAEALDLPLLAISRLGVLAYRAGTNAAVLDAGRGEFYFIDKSGEALFLPDEIRPRLNGSIAACEDRAAQMFPEAAVVDPPSAADALAFALPRLAAKDFDDVAMVDGNYLRRSDAEIFAKRARETTNAGAE
jgi:tRNA threonylcarbamoyladenosine biosynthesis protein TsaB